MKRMKKKKSDCAKEAKWFREEAHRSPNPIWYLPQYNQTSCPFNGGFRISFKSCVYLWCIQCQVNEMTLDAPKINTTFEGKFGTLNQKDEVWILQMILTSFPLRHFQRSGGSCESKPNGHYSLSFIQKPKSRKEEEEKWRSRPKIYKTLSSGTRARRPGGTEWPAYNVLRLG